MTQRTIRLADLSPEPVKVDLFDHVYELRQITRSVQKNLERAQKALESDAEQADKIVPALAGALDVLLAPVGDETQPAKQVLEEAWKADKLTLSQLNELFNSLQEAAVARPT